MNFMQPFKKSVMAVVLMSATAGAMAQTIKIGEINSYKAHANFLGPYKKGMEPALEEINSSGGLLGKKVEIISRDDNANPGDAAEPLTDKIVWENGNRYTFRLRPSTWMQVAMLVPEAAKLKKKRWALVYPNYEYGQSAANTFKQLLKAAQPDVEFVAEQAPPLGKLDAPAVTQALADAKPDAIFNVLFGPDLSKFVREGSTRNLFKSREVFSVLSGEPEYLDPLKEEAPVGWYVTGYPWYGIATPEHKRFLDAYQKKFNDYPRLGSVVGYSAIMSIAAGIKKADSTQSEKLVDAFHGLPVETPLGRINYRAQDNQSTMGAFVGRTAQKDGKGVMVNYQYLDGAKFQPADAEIKVLRKAP